MKIGSVLNAISVDHEGGKWVATNNDPNFYLCDWDIWKGKCIEISFRLNTMNLGEHVTPVLYIDSGEGFSEANSIKFQICSSESYSAVLTLPENVIALRLDPIAASEEFSFEKLEAREVSSSHVALRSNWNYLNWLSKYGRGAISAATINEAIAEWSFIPTVSVVIDATKEDNHSALNATLGSVLSQLYTIHNVVVFLNPDRLEEPGAPGFGSCQSDVEISIVCEEGAPADIFASLCDVSVDWVCFVRSGQILDRDAIYWFLRYATSGENVAFLYSDSDSIGQTGVRNSPILRPKWNDFLFMSTNYIDDMVFINGKLISQAIRSRNVVSVFSLCLALFEDNVGNIEHVDRILWHQLSSDSNNVLDLEGQCGAIADYFSRKGVVAESEPDVDSGLIRIRFSVIGDPPLVSIIIPTRNGLSVLKKCIESILSLTDYTAYEVILVDNGTDDPEALLFLQQLRGHEKFLVLRDDRPFNYSALNNLAIERAKGEVIVLMNNDVEVLSEGWLSELVGLTNLDEIGVVGTKLLYPDRTVQHAGVVLGIGGVAGHISHRIPCDEPGYMKRGIALQNVSAVTAACLAIRKEKFVSLGGLDEDNLAVSFSDVDLCLKALAQGYKNVLDPQVVLIHHESVSRGSDAKPENIERCAKEAQYMVQSWGPTLISDPFYHRGFSLEHNDFSLAWPPMTPKHAEPESRAFHILFLTQKMCLGFGVDVVVQNLAIELRRLGVRVTIACLMSDGHFPESDVKVINPTLVDVESLVATESVDCIVAHTSPFFELLPDLRVTVPRWAYEHGDPSPEFFDEDGAGRAQIKANKVSNCYPYISGVIAISEFIRSDIEWRSASIVFNGCNHMPDLGRKLPQSFISGAPGELRVGVLMRLGSGESKYKGNAVFRRFVSLCRERGSNFKFFVMGRGEDEDAREFAEMGVTVFLNATDGEKVDYLRMLDVFFTPSIWEGANLPLVEAQALGTLGVAFDTGAHPEMTPFIVSSLDELFSFLDALARNLDLLTRHSSKSYDFVRDRFSWQRSTEKMLEIVSANRHQNRGM